MKFKYSKFCVKDGSEKPTARRNDEARTCNGQPDAVAKKLLSIITELLQLGNAPIITIFLNKKPSQSLEL
jgi:hypothetical protein